MLTYHNKALTIGSSNAWIHTWEPVGARTLRFRFLGVRAQPSTTSPIPMPVTLSFLQSCQEHNSVGAVWTQVAENVFDWHYDNAAWGASSASSAPLFMDTYVKKGSSADSILKYYYFDIVEGNFSGVTTISYLFRDCNAVHINALRNMASIEEAKFAFAAHGTVSRQSLVHIDDLYMPSLTNAESIFLYNGKLTRAPSITTSNCTNMRNMFNGCISLAAVPLYDTSSATVTGGMFYGCVAVESGALALYNQASTQATPPTSYSGMFTNCGANTTSGALELAQIPSSWGGTGA